MNQWYRRENEGNEEAEKKRERKLLDNEGKQKTRWFRIWNSIWILGAPEDEEKERRAEGLFEQIGAENFPKLGKETDI